MWPFTKSKLDKLLDEAYQHTEKFEANSIKEFEQFRKQGEHFKYCGRDMIVVSYSQIQSGYGIAPNILRAVLRADYADEYGIIRQATFRPHELQVLKAENP